MSAAPGKREEDSSLRTYRKLRTASIVCACFVAIEFVGGYVSGSLAVFSDAVHLATDLLAFLIAMMASRFATRRESKTFNYGYRRLESLAALCSVSSLVVVTLWLLWQSVVRFLAIAVLHRNQGGSGNGIGDSNSDSHEDFEFVINGAVMSGTAALGVMVNIVLALVLKENHVHLPGAQCNGDHSSGGACGPNCNHSLGGGFGTSSKRVGKALGDGSTDETAAEDKASGGSNNNNNNNNNDIATTSKPRKSIKPFELMSMDLAGCKPCVPLPITGIITKPGATAKLSTTTVTNQFNFVPKRQPTQPKVEPIEIGSATESETDDDEYDDENYDSDDMEAQPLNPQNSFSSYPTKSQTIKLREMVNVNLSAAYLHALTDLIQSVLVLVTGIIIWYKPHWHWLDPLLTVCFSVLVLLSSRPIFQRAISVLLDTCPFEDEADYDTVKDVIHRVASMFSSSASIIKVCCLRIWSVSDGLIGLTCHITRQTKNNNSGNKTGTAVVLNDIVRTLEKDFGIDGKYVTIQIVDSQSSRCASCGVL